jgi:hypothetical protein
MEGWREGEREVRRDGGTDGWGGGCGRRGEGEVEWSMESKKHALGGNNGGTASRSVGEQLGSGGTYTGKSYTRVKEKTRDEGKERLNCTMREPID